MRPLLATAAAALALACAPAVAAAAPPVNDAYLTSLPVDSLEFTATVDTTEATTQADILNPDNQGQPFGGGGPETTACKGTSFGKTVWYDISPRVNRGVQIRATGLPTVVAVYEYDPRDPRDPRMLDCSANAANEDLLLDLKGRHAYTVQVGGVGGAGGPLALKIDSFEDTDADGQLDPLDKCPEVAGIERFGGCPPELRAVPSVNFDRAGGGVRITRLNVDRVPKGAKVVARCTGCGSQTVKAKRQGRVSLGRLVGRSVPAGGSIEVRVTMAGTGRGTYRFGATGSLFRWPVRAGGLGARVTRCLAVGTGKVERCR